MCAHAQDPMLAPTVQLCQLVITTTLQQKQEATAASYYWCKACEGSGYCAMQVIIEYDEGGVDEFISAADAIEAAFPGVAVEGNPEGQNMKKAAFSISLQDGTIIYQRAPGDPLPTAAAIVSCVQKRTNFPATEASVGCM
jgi:hypothetical protein